MKQIKKDSKYGINLLKILLFVFLLPQAYAARLPVVGGDIDLWGDVLNDYLLQQHNGSGGSLT